jgi:hypothetical protein
MSMVRREKWLVYIAPKLGEWLAQKMGGQKTREHVNEGEVVPTGTEWGKNVK